MMEENWLEIKEIKAAGKWLEFWFVGGVPAVEGSFHECCKQYMFWDLLEKAGISQIDVMNKGIQGMKVVWEGDRPIKVEYNIEETREERRVERVRNLLTPLYNLPQMIVDNDGRFDKIIKETAQQAIETQPFLDKALDLNTTHDELHELYENPENRRSYGKEKES